MLNIFNFVHENGLDVLSCQIPGQVGIDITLTALSSPTLDSKSLEIFRDRQLLQHPAVEGQGQVAGSTGVVDGKDVVAAAVVGLIALAVGIFANHSFGTHVGELIALIEEFGNSAFAVHGCLRF